MAEWLPLSRLMRDAPDARVVAGDGAIRNIAQLRRTAHAWRTAFAQRPGRWALHFDDTLAFAAALLGAWHAGATVWLCGDALPATLDALRGEVTGFAGDIPHEYGPLPPAAASDDRIDWPELDETRTRLVVFTSGSTGAPIAIGKSLAQLARELEALEQCFGAVLGGAAVHGTVSHQHIYGLLFRALWPLAAGRPIAPRRFFHEDVAHALANVPASVLVTTPAHLRRLPEGLDWTGAAQSLRAVFSSGGALPESAARDALRLLGRAPLEIYGSSETGGIAWRGWQESGASEWRALPGVTWRIVEGQLDVRSPHLPTQDWWRSEDRVEAQGEGFRLLGRADRIVKIEERRVSLDALERALCALDEVREARVLMLPGARVQLGAVIVPSPEGGAMPTSTGRRAFTQLLSQALAAQQDAVTRPRRWRFVPALPLNAQGKTTEALLLALFNEESLSERPPAVTPAKAGAHPQTATWVPAFAGTTNGLNDGGLVHPAPEWLETTPSTAHARVLAHADLIVFDGHFPGVPILPGVAQLDWAIRMAREVFALPPHVLRVEALKFQNVVRPGTALDLTLGWDTPKQQLTFCWQSDAGLHARGRILLHERT